MCVHKTHGANGMSRMKQQVLLICSLFKPQAKYKRKIITKAVVIVYEMRSRKSNLHSSERNWHAERAVQKYIKQAHANETARER